ncbi:MAG TPA: DegQ family serine endoprotease [Burkholderiales bacterium]|nr:DegQ family serine endoprotease [Burkholderiales bacterium]
MKWKLPTLRATLLAALIPVFAAGCTTSTAAPPHSAAGATTSSIAAPTAASHGAPDFTQLVKQAGPAVVNISVTKEAKAQNQQFDENDPMYQFFKRFGVPMPQQGPMHGIGSGFIVSPDGYILTNAHVVDGVDQVHVKLTDRREFTAKVIGSDKKTDVALIKIDASNLPAVKVGDSKQVQVGQWVAAVGSPFGFENSVTAGIVSATSRSLPGGSYVPFIQTDVAVNPGNSGGPLFDLDGNVVGINSQIYSESGGYMGLSFAIPIDVAMNVMQQLKTAGHVTRGRIGVAVQNVNQSLAQSFGLPKPEGALVSSVDDKGPAKRAGLKPGDVILAWNGKPIDESADLPVLVANTKPGEHAQMKVWRDGAEHTLGVTVGTMPDEKVASANQANPDANSGKLGLMVQQGDEGLVVAQASGPAAKAGVQPGDVILGVNNQPVKSVAELRRAVEKAGKHIALLVQRGDATVYVPVDLG